MMLKIKRLKGAIKGFVDKGNDTVVFLLPIKKSSFYGGGRIALMCLQ